MDSGETFEEERLSLEFFVAGNEIRCESNFEIRLSFPDRERKD